MNTSISSLRNLALSLLAAAAVVGAMPVRAADTRNFDIPPGELSAALKTLAQQTGLELIFRPGDLKGLRTQGVKGNLSAQDAVARLIDGAKLTIKTDPAGAILITPARANAQTMSLPPSPGQGERPEVRVVRADQTKVGQNQADSRSASEESDSHSKVSPDTDPGDETGIPEVLVQGRRSLNTDIRRSREDAQPYVVFDRATIERSGAQNLEEFFKNRLTMNSAGASSSQGSNFSGNKSSVNLRGLGENQTLILVDGRRISSGYSFAGIPAQPDLNGVPLAAIERIEILPTTASGIYGGSATGGVVNVILRRDYHGAEVKLGYDNTFDSDSAVRRINIGSGLVFEEGRSHLMFAAAFSDANPLSVAERDFMRNGQARILANNPGFYFNAANPPLGARPNIRSVNGSPLFGPGTPYFTTVPAGYTSASGLGPLQANAGTYNFDLPDTAQGPSGRHRALANNPTVRSGMLTLRRTFSPTIDAFLELSSSKNEGRFMTGASTSSFRVESTAPNNPFGQAIQVTVPYGDSDTILASTLEDRRVVAGLIAQLPHRWRLSADYTQNRFRFNYASLKTNTGTGMTEAIGDGTLDVLQDLTQFPVSFAAYMNAPVTLLTPQKVTLNAATARLAGPVRDIGGGSVTLSTALEHRDEQIGDSYQYNNPTTSFLYPSRSQKADSAYAELSVPFFSSLNRRAGVEELRLQLAVRHERYTTEGSTGFVINPTPASVVEREKNRVSSTDPTVSLSYRPVQDLMVRMSYGTGFLPPAVSQLLRSTPAPSSGAGLSDPARGNEPLDIHQAILGGNPDLQPEQSRSVSMGAVITPRAIPGLRFSIDYSRIEKTDNILSPSAQVILDNPELLGSRVTRGPNRPGDLPGWPGPVILMDRSAVNISSAEVEAYDVAFDYTRELAGRGDLALFLGATRQTHYKTQLAPSEPLLENVGITSAYPSKFKANAGLTWAVSSWTVGWAARYFDAYLVADPRLSSAAATFLNQGGRRISSQLYHDVFAGYEFSSRGLGWVSALNGLDVKLGLGNVFNAKPPFDAANGNYYSPYGDPRLRTYSLAATMKF